MRFGLAASALLHGGAVALAFVSLPDFLRTKVESEPGVPIELITKAELDLRTSVPAAAPEPVEEPVETPDLPDPEPEAPPVETAPQPEPEPAPLPEPEPEPEPVESEPEPEPKPEPPKPEKKPEPAKPKPEPESKSDELDFSQLSAVVDKLRENEPPSSAPPSQTTETADQARAAIGAGDRLTASDKAKMRAAVSRCWNASAIAGAPNPEKLVVIVQFELNEDGTLQSPPRVANRTQIALSGNRFWQAAQQNAVRAVQSCAPYDFLPVDRYNDWKEFELNFDPAQMAGF